ncbi:MAG: response regulator [Anaerolinea sp.]|nr:response regulator [Anaerolinea sp.]
MSERLADNVIITDPQAGGAREKGEGVEARKVTQTSVMPPLRLTGLNVPPAAETGLINAVVLSGEGADHDDRQDASRTTAETQGVLEVTQGQRPTVLIIEDTAELAEILQVTLEHMGMITAHESHGGRAFVRFNAMMPDIVLLDIGLPDITGWKVLESIKDRQRESGGRMPIVIVITAYGDPANRLVGKLHGVHNYLIKPFTPDEVVQVVRNALSSASG